MRLQSARSAAAVLSFALFSTFAQAQTYSKCNPLERSCPANPALGGSTEVDFTAGASSDFTGSGNSISYGSSGAQLTVSGPGDNPTLTSQWYIMFGHVDFVFKAAPGVGMVSSAILISDDLDEIDWELLGADPSSAQSNYFGKGITGSYNRGGFSSVPSSQTEFNTYSIDWTSERIEFQINGQTVRTVTAAQAGDQYPQTPMQVKIGSWAGGDASNAEGTITWAGGPINYGDGPFVMEVQSMSVTDYSTGSAYQYSGTDGSWEQVQAIGGSVNPSGGVSAPPAPSPPTAHRPHSSHSPSPSPSSPPSPSGAPACETIAEYDQHGDIYTVTAPQGWHKTWDAEGVLVTPPPCGAAKPTPNRMAPAPVPTTLATSHVSPVKKPSSSAGASATRPVSSAQTHNTFNQNPKGAIPQFTGDAGLRSTATFSAAAAFCAIAAFVAML